MRAYGCGGETVTVTRGAFEKYYAREKPNLRKFAAAIEDIDYLQQSKCPSNAEELELSDPRFHIIPLIDRLVAARIELNANLGFPLDESVVSDTMMSSVRSVYDEVDERLVLRDVHGVELLAREELDRVQAFLADMGYLSRLRYPDLEDQNVNIHNLAVEIDDGGYIGDQEVMYTCGARDNLKERFENLISLLEGTVSAYDVEIEMNDITEHDQLDKWFPPEDNFRDVLGALIRWSECWVGSLKLGLDALNTIGPPPIAKPGGTWGRLGRAASKLRKSFSGVLPTSWSREPSVERNNSG
ncbi:hypothetical protein H072_11457 [Dactylellina haptotyla CBS 200.50]|uniref:Uncharacterized protein n=1 Tax=Dactylellina haptotyla (strain CBS 200.50) TaxID=1284197 RepID=S7ZWS4_DACHA|nr:hypothetical protein H072_11457 [Dactylellina haptotyla CBS 200.50]